MGKLRVVEAWKDICGYEGIYKVSNTGRIISMSRKISNGKGFYMSRNREIFGTVTSKGYVSVELNGKHHALHRIVASAFIENKYCKPQVNHIDCNKQNNNYTNLEWCNNSENQIHAYKNGLNKRSDLAGRKKRKVCCFDLRTLEEIKTFESVSDARKWLGLKKDNIYQVCNGKRNKCGGYGWKYMDKI